MIVTSTRKRDKRLRNEQGDCAGGYPVDRIGALGIGGDGREVVVGAEHVVAAKVEAAGASSAAAGAAAGGCTGAGHRGSRVLVRLLGGEGKAGGEDERMMRLASFFIIFISFRKI
jgi:hypothetical protein